MSRKIIISIKLELDKIDSSYTFIDLTDKKFNNLKDEIPMHVKKISKTLENTKYGLEDLKVLSIDLSNKRTIKLMYFAKIDLKGDFDFDSYNKLYRDIEEKIENYELEDFEHLEQLDVECEVNEISDWSPNTALVSSQIIRLVTAFRAACLRTREKFKKS